VGGPKLRMTVPVPGGTTEVDVPDTQQTQAAISDAQCLDAVRLAQSLEAEMGWPVDVECAWSSGVLHLLRCRPITTLPTDEGNTDGGAVTPRQTRRNDLERR
jgi:phosphoenolpyruvate synthase/pyruvate phosphate dikinase